MKNEKAVWIDIPSAKFLKKCKSVMTTYEDGFIFIITGKDKKELLKHTQEYLNRSDKNCKLNS